MWYNKKVNTNKLNWQHYQKAQFKTGVNVIENWLILRFLKEETNQNYIVQKIIVITNFLWKHQTALDTYYLGVSRILFSEKLPYVARYGCVWKEKKNGLWDYESIKYV